LEGPGDIDKTYQASIFKTQSSSPQRPGGGGERPEGGGCNEHVRPWPARVIDDEIRLLGCRRHYRNSPLTHQTKILGIHSLAYSRPAPMFMLQSPFMDSSSARLHRQASRSSSFSAFSGIAEPTVAHSDGSTKIGSVRTRSPEWKRSSADGSNRLTCEQDHFGSFPLTTTRPITRAAPSNP